MPFNMFKAFSSGSRNRTHRGDPAIYADYPQGYPSADFQPEPVIRSQPQVLRRSSTKRREPLFTPLPSRTPSDTDEYNEGYIRVDSPDAVMGGALNARPGKIDSVLPPLGAGIESPLSESFSERQHREHAGRMYDVPRVMDRPPQLRRTPSFHTGLGDRIDHDEPIVMTHSRGGSSPGSDDTIEAFQTPHSVHPSDRVIPPLPHNYTGGYPPGSRSPTDIYGNHPYEVVHDVHSHHNPERYRDPHGRSRGYGRDGGPVYYVIPGGMNVIFQDEHGKEISRVGDFSGRSRPSRPGPYVVQDEHGRELYRYDGHDRGAHRGDPPIVRIDAHSSSGHLIHDRNYSSRGYRSDPYKRGYDDYYPDHREYRDHRERDWRDHRDHRDRGYGDHPGYSEYTEHRGYRDPNRDYGDYRDRGGYRDHGRYRDHGGYREYSGRRDHGRYGEYSGRRDHRGGEYGEHDGYGEHGEYNFEIQPPSRVSSRASHRTHTSRVSAMGGAQQPYLSSIPDERRTSHISMPQPEDDVDISGGLQALHI